jgi:hypothetical protein
MKRVEGFAAGEKVDEGWIVVKVKLRPSWVAALKTEATREGETLHRKVFLSDLIRDAIRAFMLIRRISPAKRARFVPSDQSEKGPAGPFSD